MKKHLIIAFAICVLFLSACGSLVETSTSATYSTAHATGSITTASTQSFCRGQHDQQAQLSQQYQAASVQLSEAQARGHLQQVKEAERGDDSVLLPFLGMGC